MSPEHEFFAAHFQTLGFTLEVLQTISPIRTTVKLHSRLHPTRYIHLCSKSGTISTKRLLKILQEASGLQPEAIQSAIINDCMQCVDDAQNHDWHFHLPFLNKPQER
jgi:hypothetical protein